MHTTHIREHQPQDEASVVALARQLQKRERSDYDRMKHEDDIGPWYVGALLKSTTEFRGALLVAEREGALVGYATVLSEISEEKTDEVLFQYAYIGDLVVAEGLRREGIGKMLLLACEERAKRAGSKWRRLSVLAKNQNARAVYQNFGFLEHLITLEKPL